jgi:anti-sigma regulatory factor (Ser/Thr protein kinase)
LPYCRSGWIIADSMKRKIEFASHPGNLCSVRSLVRQFAAEARLPAAEVDLIVLGIDEACTNIIRHTYQQEETRLIGLSCEQIAGGVRFRLRHYGGNGCSTEPGQWSGRSLDSVQPGGLGLHFINTVFDQVDYRPKSKGMELVLTKKVKHDAAGAAL